MLQEAGQRILSPGPGLPDFSFAILSICIRSRASWIFPNTYCPARYVAPTIPAPIAMPFRFRLIQRRVADIMVVDWYKAPLSWIRDDGEQGHDRRRCSKNLNEGKPCSEEYGQRELLIDLVHLITIQNPRLNMGCG